MDYFDMPEVPGKKFFICEKLRAKLTTSACAFRWEHAQGTRPDRRNSALRLVEQAPDERFGSCMGCSIGAMHAGEPDRVYSSWYRKPICNRCARPASRLINGRICPSCYNRGSEFVKGVNAKGTAPVKLAKMGGLAARCIRYRVDTEVHVEKTGLTLDTTEAVVGVLRSTPGRIAFAFAGLVPVLEGLL